MKSVSLSTLPAGLVTEILPVVAPDGTVALIELETTVNEAETPLNLTLVALSRSVPEMVTWAPIVPEVGVKLLMVGGLMTVKLLELEPEPLGVVTLIAPVVAPEGTVTVIWESVSTENALVEVPLNETSVAPVKLEPLMVTEAPTAPLVGVKLVILGRTLNEVLLEPVPTLSVTLIGPVVAPEGTMALI